LRTVWRTVGRPILEAALALVLAALLAECVLAAVASTGAVEPGLHAGGSRLSPPAFLLHAAGTQMGLLVVTGVLLLTRGGRVPLRIARRDLAPSVLGLLVLLSINVLASWGMEELREAYLGVPEIPMGVMGVLVVAVAAGFAPVAEELFFREALLCRVFAASPRPFAILLTSFGFGALHLGVGGPVLFLALSGMGAVLAVVRLRTGSLGAAIVIHAANNLAALALATSGGTSP